MHHPFWASYFSGDWDANWGYDLDFDPWPLFGKANWVQRESLLEDVEKETPLRGFLLVFRKIELAKLHCQQPGFNGESQVSDQATVASRLVRFQGELEIWMEHTNGCVCVCVCAQCVKVRI